MPNAHNNLVGDDNRISSRDRQGAINNIESTVTPSRAPLSLQQQLIQPSPSIRRLKPFPHIGQPHAISFDVAPNSPIQHSSNYHQTSYQHKLLQLQLLHNSNNVDYIRNNGLGSDNNNDYQIYGPESIATNHYGYSSMRSNLKSAASEFSFIRPSSMTQHTASQSTLPRKNFHSNFVLLDNHSASNNNHLTRPAKSWLVSSKDGINDSSQVQKIDGNNNEIGSSQRRTTCQYLINPLTGERIYDQANLHLFDNKGETKIEAMAALSDLVPPMRELPMKPGKKKTINNNTCGATNNANMPKSSSLTSSIACFFRRAFSRRSKRGNSKRRAAKLAESCSSSLGAFEDNFSNVAVTPSAFSTGSKSIDIRKNDQQMHYQQQMPQPQRMIDMIEAFTNKTLADNIPGSVQAPYNASVVGREQGSVESNLIRGGQNKQPRLRQRARINQFGSPLHKSNSISATMGLSHTQDINERRNFLYDNELVGNITTASGGSPMLMRSTKVMSVNLTPLMSQREQSDEVTSNQKQFFLSPRNNRQDHQMPRPSSIYGQPSMISSPSITRGVGLDQGANNFGLHRNSIHNSHFRDKSGQHNNSGLEIRRQQVIKTPYLDTTREVAEDIPSPTTAEPKIFGYDPTQQINQSIEQSAMPTRVIQQSRIAEHSSPSISSGRKFMVDTRDRNFDIIRASPSNKSQQKAIVNPILQSPTMDTIYDNHPMLNVPELPTHSHYDNHNKILMDSSNNSNIHGRSPSLRSSNVTQIFPSSSMVCDQDRYIKHRIVSDISMNNAPYNARSLSPAEMDRVAAFDMMVVNKKPSANVAPSTPNHHQQFRTDGKNLDISSPTIDQFSGNRGKLNQATYSSMAALQQQPLPQPPQSRSPMLSRRLGNNQTGHYQQSPLVSQQTRVLNKGDGIQATVIGDRESLRYTQPVVNIAGAPGINLEPSLAASLLRGTNIDAYESSAFNRNTSDSLSSKSNSKAFLVSTRLSKSLAQSSQHSSNRDNSSPTSTFKDESSIASTSNSTTCPKSSREEISSSGSRCRSPSIGRSSSRVKILNASRSSSQDDQQEDSSSGDNRSGEKSKSTGNNSNKSETKLRGGRCFSNNRKLQRQTSDHGASRNNERRESSSEHSDEVGSNAESLGEKLDERNWITSKLVE